jgi:hypothetical protein
MFLRAAGQGLLMAVVLYTADVAWSVVGRGANIGSAIVTADSLFSVSFGLFIGFCSAMFRLNMIDRMGGQPRSPRRP